MSVECASKKMMYLLIHYSSMDSVQYNYAQCGYIGLVN